MKRFLAVVLCIVALGSLMVACGTGNATPDSATFDEKPAVDGEASMLNVQTYDIKTKYCTLKYPAMWEDAVTVETKSDNPYTLGFTGKVDDKSLPLFDLAFDSAEGIALGTLHGDQDHTLSMIAYEITENDCSADQYRLFCGMQEDVNIIISNLKQDYDFET